MLKDDVLKMRSHLESLNLLIKKKITWILCVCHIDELTCMEDAFMSMCLCKYETAYVKFQFACYFISLELKLLEFMILLR